MLHHNYGCHWMLAFLDAVLFRKYPYLILRFIIHADEQPETLKI